MLNWLPGGLQQEGILAQKNLPSDKAWRTPHQKPVGIVHGDSTEFLLVETFDRLEVIRQAVTVAWNRPRRFEESEECLAGKALTSFKRLVRDCYPDPADKTDANYEDLCMLMPTDLGDHTYPGNKIRQYANQKFKYMNFCREDGRR